MHQLWCIAPCDLECASAPCLKIFPQQLGKSLLQYLTQMSTVNRWRWMFYGFRGGLPTRRMQWTINFFVIDIIQCFEHAFQAVSSRSVCAVATLRAVTCFTSAQLFNKIRLSSLRFRVPMPRPMNLSHFDLAELWINLRVVEHPFLACWRT